MSGPGEDARRAPAGEAPAGDGTVAEGPEGPAAEDAAGEAPVAKRSAGESPAAGRPAAGRPAAEEFRIEVRPSDAVANPLDAVHRPRPAGTSEGRPTFKQRLDRRSPLKLPSRHNPKLAALINRLNGDGEVYALWAATNVTAVDRLRMSDHGPVHVQIVANSALRILRLLLDAGVTSSIEFDYGLEKEDAEVVVALAALFHDVGMSIHRDDHENFSLFVAQPILRRHLAEVYEPPVDAIVRSEILHAIIAHRSGGSPLTVEAGVLRIADALDMAEGRSRIPFEAGSMSIHAVSAAAVEAVHIERGESTAVLIRIEMSNSAGVFQVDQLLRRKLAGSGLEKHIQVEAHIEGETEKRLVTRFRL